MKKKIALLLALLALATGLLLTACDEPTPPAPPHTHTLTLVESAAPQCNTPGNIEHYACTGCDKTFADEEGETELADVSTGTVDCVYVDCICKWCGGNNHTLTHTEGVAPQCNKAGTLEHWTCSVCERIYTDAAATQQTESTVAERVPCEYIDGLCKWCGWNTDGYVRCDKDGTPNASGDYILFGEYPQTIKAPDVTVSNERDDRGYYLGSDGAYYAKVKAGPKEEHYRFSDNTKIVKDTIYYFKVEPIRWRILKTEDGKAFLFCDSIINCKTYTTYADSLQLKRTNDYETSSIRKWLNETFYENAFGDLQRSLIETTTLDNSAKTTGCSWYKYPYKNTTDKVFLLSYQAATYMDYGFDYATRRMQASDYSRARGVYMNTTKDYYGCGAWWLRSPFKQYNQDEDNYSVSTVNYDGDTQYYGPAGRTQIGVVPALYIRLK